MRRKRKIRYYVQDWSDGPRLWYLSRKWGECRPGSTNMVYCKTFDQAERVARRLKAAGGTPLISRRVSGRKARWEDFDYIEG